MDIKTFTTQPFLQGIRSEPRWTVSNDKKIPLDINAIKNYGIIRGATFGNENQPLTDLDTLAEILPDATNAAFSLNQALDDIVVLDIEPSCPEELKHRLEMLPALYRETSMSGHGLHLVMHSPKNTQYEHIRIGKPAIKPPSKFYEILMNHYVTFTGNVVPEPDGTLLPYEDFVQLFCEIAESTPTTKYADCDIGDLPEPDDIPCFERIIGAVMENKYKKTPKDFADEKHPTGDISSYEFGMAGFYNFRLKRTLDLPMFRNHDYTLEERMVMLHHILKEKLEYREKHDTARDGLPWLYFTCKRVLTTVPGTSKSEK